MVENAMDGVGNKSRTPCSYHDSGGFKQAASDPVL